MKQDNTKSGNPGISYIKEDKSGSDSSIGSAIVMIAIVVMSLVLLKIETNNTIKPLKNTALSSSTRPASDDKTSSIATTNTISSSSLKSKFNGDEADIVRKRMKQILAATKKVPFKARISTETGFKGFWTQNALNYRFEDPVGSQAIIFNADKKRLWVLDISKKIAFETMFNDESADAYGEFSPAMFLEALSGTTDMAKKGLEDILPAGDKAKLTFNAIGLPKRWDGIRSDGTAAFIVWDYTALADIPDSDFELPEGVIVKSLTSNQIEPGR